MSVKGVLNLSAVLLSCISALLTFCSFVLFSFYSTAQAKWEDAAQFKESAERRLQTLEQDAKAQREIVSKDISEIKATLSQIVEVKLKR